MPNGGKPLEDLRLKAAALFVAKKTIPQVMTELGVTRWKAYRWHRLYRLGGREALLRKAGHGKSLGLDARQWFRLSRALAKDPAASKISGDRWTLPLFANLVTRVSGKPCDRTMAFHILTDLGYKFEPPPPRRELPRYARRPPGKWTRKANPKIPAHLLPPECRPR